MTTQVASSLLSSSDSSMPHLHDHLNNNAHASCSTSSLSSPSVPSTPTVIHSDTNATGSTSASATPRPVRGIKRRLPDHPTPLTERLSSGDVHQQRNSPSSSASASPRKRQGRSSTPPIRSASRRGSARRSLQEFKAESSQSASSSSKSAATLDAGGGNADDQDQQPEKSQEELREEQMFQNWKEEYFEIVDQLPLELHRSSALMKELESQIHTHLKAIHSDTIAYRDYRKQLSNEQPPTEQQPYKRPATLNRISAACSMAMASAEEKVGLALSAYNLIDRHCRRLDSDLAKTTGVQGEAGADPAAGAEPGAVTAQTAPFELRENTQESTRSQRLTGRGRSSALASSSAKDVKDEAESTARGRRSGRGSIATGEAHKTGTLIKKNEKSKTTTKTPTISTVDSTLPDMPVDPNEPVYCYCRGPSSGTMVGCENEECEREWFHLPCVGLTAAPPEHVKWYCNDCRPDGHGSVGGGAGGGRKKKRKSGR